MSRIRAAFHDPDGDRYGIPTYWWRGAPDGYATRRQLRAAGLRPGGQDVAAQILWAGVGGTRTAYLYRTDLARPKRTATPAQLRAVAAALRARRTCPTCRQEQTYYIRRSLGECQTCHDNRSTPGRRAPSTPHTREPNPMPDNPLLRVALAAAARGWHVFPLRPDDKRPAVRDWETRATTDPDRIRRCWTAGPYGVAIACGPSALVVVDLDVPKPGQTPPPEWSGDDIATGADVFTVLCVRADQPIPADTYSVATGRGGTHFYYQHPTDGPPLRNTAGTLGWLVDTRAHGGYVVAAGTTVARRPYTVMENTDPAALPGWLAERLRPVPLPPQRPVVVELPGDRQGVYLRAAIDRQLAYLTQAREGNRNRALYVSAVALGQLAAGEALGQDQAAALLEQAALSIGLTAREAARTIRSGLTAGARRPRTVAA